MKFEKTSRPVNKSFESEFLCIFFMFFSFVSVESGIFMRKQLVKILSFFIFATHCIILMGQHSSFGIVIHGGAGNLSRKLNKEEEEAYKKVLREAVEQGYSVLEAGGSAVEAVEAAVRIMEDSPMFNAGKGSVLNEEGYVEMDASIMDGKTHKAGAVAGVREIRNPVTAAKKVMELTPHVMLVGSNADKWAKKSGIPTETSEYFITEKRKKAWEAVNKKGEILLDHESEKYGTVGAVALDKNGNVAAATSTGGLMNKMAGRVGDTPVIGAGTFAENQYAAVSCTGVGEFFMKNLIAYQVILQMRFLNKSLSEAVNNVIDFLTSVQGAGGIIAIDKTGNVQCAFNTKIMHRAYKTSLQPLTVKIYADENKN